MNDFRPLDNTDGPAPPVTRTIHQSGHQPAMRFQQVISSFGSPIGEVLIRIECIFDLAYLSWWPHDAFPFDQGRNLVFGERVSFDGDTPMHSSHSQRSTQLRSGSGVMQSFVPSQQSFDVGKELNGERRYLDRRLHALIVSFDTINTRALAR